MEEGSYSANGVKHCIRPCDMTGKSSAVILRQMHPNVVQEATKYDRHVDLPMWLSSLSLEDDSIPYYKQKDLECAEIDKLMNNNNDLTENGGASRKRGPKTTVLNLEKKILKQRQKDEKEVARLMEDMLRRVEVKAKEALRY